jgi:hypothetical protein
MNLLLVTILIRYFAGAQAHYLLIFLYWFEERKNTTDTGKL